MPRRIRRGKRARLRLTLSAPARLKIVVQRRVHGHRIRVRTLNVDAPAGRVSIRLPGRSTGRALERGRYRVSVVVIDAAEQSLGTVRRLLRVRERAR